MKTGDFGKTRIKNTGSEIGMGKVVHYWKLDSPDHCRNFLSDLWFNRRRVQFVTTESGKELYFRDMDDSQVVFYANEISKMVKAKSGPGN